MLKEEMEKSFSECFVISDPTSALPDEVFLSYSAEGITCGDPTRSTDILFPAADVMAVCAIIPGTDPEEMEELSIHVRNKGRFAFEVNDARLLRAACRKWLKQEGGKSESYEVQNWLQCLDQEGVIRQKRHCLTDTDPSGFLPDEFWLYIFKEAILLVPIKGHLDEPLEMWTWDWISGAWTSVDDEGYNLLHIDHEFGKFVFECTEAENVSKRVASMGRRSSGSREEAVQAPASAPAAPEEPAKPAPTPEKEKPERPSADGLVVDTGSHAKEADDNFLPLVSSPETPSPRRLGEPRDRKSRKGSSQSRGTRRSIIHPSVPYKSGRKKGDAGKRNELLRRQSMVLQQEKKNAQETAKESRERQREEKEIEDRKARDKQEREDRLTTRKIMIEMFGLKDGKADYINEFQEWQWTEKLHDDKGNAVLESLSQGQNALVKSIQNILKDCCEMYIKFAELNSGYANYEKASLWGESADPFVSELSQQLYLNKEPTNKFRPFRQKIKMLFSQMSDMEHRVIEVKSKLKSEGLMRTADDDDKCMICHSIFQPGDLVRTLTCLHVFHSRTCLDPWMLGHDCCPTCNQKVMTDRHTEKIKLYTGE